MQKPITISKDSNFNDVIKKLLYYNISRLIVEDKKKPVGIISEKDIGIYLFTDKTNRSLEQIPLGEIMKKIVYVEPSASVSKCVRTMTEKKIGSLVVGSEDNIDGILTKTDIIRNYAENHAGENKVWDIKMPGYISISAETSISEVIKKMLEKKISRIIVSNQNNEPIGIITFKDFFEISLQLSSDEDVTEAAALSGHVRKGFLSEEGFGGISLGRDIMTKKIISVKPDDDLALVCEVMLNNHVNGLAVIGKEKTIGVISKTDIIKFLA